VVTVDEFMTQDIRAVDEDCPIAVTLKAMQAGPFRRVPVVNKKGKLVGLLSIDDVLDLLAEEFKTIIRLLGNESPNAVFQS
jgi:CBS domain-containing protein